MGKFQIATRTNGEWQFNLKADNGQVVLTSQGYTTREACENGIESVRVNSHEDIRFDLKEASNGKYYFNLKAANGQIIGTSQMYVDANGRNNGIASVQKNAPNAPIEEFKG